MAPVREIPLEQFTSFKAENLRPICEAVRTVFSLWCKDMSLIMMNVIRRILWQLSSESVLRFQVIAWVGSSSGVRNLVLKASTLSHEYIIHLQRVVW